MMKIFKNSLKKGTVTLPPVAGGSSPEMEKLGEQLKAQIRARFGRSLHIREVDTGSCCACESEIIAAANPLYDIQRFGIDFVASPRHADCLLVTGPVSRNMALALKKTYDAMPSPKYVISFGDCGLNGGMFKESYYIAGGVNAVLPVDLHIPGCPPSPEELIRNLVSLLK